MRCLTIAQKTVVCQVAMRMHVELGCKGFSWKETLHCSK